VIAKPKSADKTGAKVEAPLLKAKRVDPVDSYKKVVARYPKVMAELAK
jgi:hypothetical protein